MEDIVLKTDKEREEKPVNQDTIAQSGAVNADMNAAAQQTNMDKFHAQQGHGYAAEQAEHLRDRITGHDAKIVGGDNKKDGADRVVDGVSIQTKYCRNAASSVQAAFKNGKYRYMNPDGTPMQLEVPSDQYEKAVELMRKRIENGQVPGVTDPNDAEALVRRGHFTYKQAVNITKFGTIESLTFDAVNGAVICTNAFGITAAITYAQRIWQGDSPEFAAEEAAYSGLQIGGAAFANSVITAQLMRTELPKLLQEPTQKIVELIGPKASAAIANALRNGANIYGAAAMNNVAKLLRSNFITSTAMVVVLSAGDISNCFRGRISGKQLFKNITQLAVSMAGSLGGAVAAGVILSVATGGAGTAVAIHGVVTTTGAIVGGMASGSAAQVVLGKFIEDDAVRMVAIMEGVFVQMAQDYLLTEQELQLVVDDLGMRLTGEKLLEMYAAKNNEGHRTFAERFVREIIEHNLQLRARVDMLTPEEMLAGIGRVFEDAEQGTGIFAQQKKQCDPVKVGEALTGKTYDPRAARKGIYAAQQMDTTQKHVENVLRKMQRDEETYHAELAAIRQERAELIGSIDSILDMGV